MPPESAARVRRAYYGLVTYVDDKVGELLAALEEARVADRRPRHDRIELVVELIEVDRCTGIEGDVDQSRQQDVEWCHTSCFRIHRHFAVDQRLDKATDLIVGD